jgi:hypothetical protein
MTTLALSLLAAAVILGSGTHAAGEQLCKPAFTVTGVTFSDMHEWRRTWTAHIAVDASRCSTASGRFNIDFTRLKEVGPDLRFSEPFTWTPGRIEATTIFAADEAVLDYAIEAAPCPCRE